MPRWTSTWLRTEPRWQPAVYDRAMDTKLLSLLVCPVTKGPLEWSADKLELWSRSARLAYPVHDGIPILLENEARTLTDQELGL